VFCNPVTLNEGVSYKATCPAVPQPLYPQLLIAGPEFARDLQALGRVAR
jgi:hypothetical protein